MRNRKALAGLLVVVMLLSALAVTALAAPGESYTGSPTTVNLTHNDDTGLYEWTDPDTGEVYTYSYDPETNTFTRNTQIEDEDTPLADGPDLNEVIQNFTPFYTDTVTIEDEETPLAALPPFIEDKGEIGSFNLFSDDGTTTTTIAGDELVVSTDGTGLVRLEEREDENGEPYNVVVYDLTTEEGTDVEADITISKNTLTEWGTAVEPIELLLDFGTVTLLPEASKDLAAYLGNVRLFLEKNDDEEANALLAMLGQEPDPYKISIVNEEGETFELVKDEGDKAALEAEDEEIDENAYQVTVPDPEDEDEEITIRGIKVDLQEETEG